MRNLTSRGGPDPVDLPTGLAFEIADLLLIRSWVDRHDCAMSIRLDHGTNGEEYEEVVAFHTGLGGRCQFIMWRNAAAVFVQPLIGRTQRYRTVAAALKSLGVKLRIVLTDITAASWPTDRPPRGMLRWRPGRHGPL